jgi:ABC-type Mn2+/Zn2+ transport system ATPase subunit
MSDRQAFEPHEHTHRHPEERRLAIVDAAVDPTHAHAHADIWLSDVTAGYLDRPALEHVDLAVEPGTLLAVVGPNGAGKSTLLKVMAGILVPWSGRVEVLRAPAGREARRIAYVPQAELVDWHFPVTVRDVVMMGRYPALGPLRRPGPLDHRAVDGALAKVGMGDHRTTQIGSLSGGQRRRVFLARALAAEPDLFLLDEPDTGVDATTQEDLMDNLEAEARRGKTVVATTHAWPVPPSGSASLAINGRSSHGPSSLVSTRRPRPDVRRSPPGARRAGCRARRRTSPRRGRAGRAPLPR